MICVCFDEDRDHDVLNFVVPSTMPANNSHDLPSLPCDHHAAWLKWQILYELMIQRKCNQVLLLPIRLSPSSGPPAAPGPRSDGLFS